MAELNWTDAQWQKVKDCVTEAFGKASVASAFLPCYGPLPGSTETVRNERLIQDDGADTVTVKLDADHDAVEPEAREPDGEGRALERTGC